MSDETRTNLSKGREQGSQGTEKLPPIAGLVQEQDLSGSTLAGYRLVRKIAMGGMGVVYEAIQTKLDRKVALKVLTEQLGSRPEFLQRFEREAKAAAALSHPNMVQVFDYGEVEGRHYIIMEYIEGLNLSSYTDEHGKFSVDHALNLVEQAAQALKAAAEKSIIHRDIKPSNLLLTADGRVKVADLGLAKILTQDSDLTMSHVSIGSPHFLAPEQADDSRSADHRADIYSLGVTLLFLVTGKHAYDGASPISIVLSHTNKPLPSGAELGTELPEEVEDLIHKMAAKDPNDRYQDYQSLILDLQRVRAGFAPTARVGKKPLRKSQLLLAGTILGCVVIIAGAALIANRSKPTAQPKTEARATQPAKTSPLEPTEVVSAFPQDEGHMRPGPGPRNAQGLPPRNPGQFEPRRGPGPGMDEHNGIRLPMGAPVMREFFDIPEGPIATMLAKADEYAAAHPQNFEEVLDCYRQVEQKAGDTPQARDVANRLQEWSNRKEQTLKIELQTREAKMDQSIHDGKMHEAFKVWADFPGGLRSRETDDHIRKLLQTKFPADWRPE